MKICDVIFFIKKDGSLGNTYQYGMINQLENSKDCPIQKAVVKYCIYHANVDRFAACAVLIHPIDKFHFTKELNNLNSS